MERSEKKMFSRQNAGESFNSRRKVFHLMGLIIPSIYLFDLFDYFGLMKFREDTRSIAFFIMSGLFLFMTVIEILRFRYKYWQDLFMRTVGKLLKDKEEKRIHGALPFMLANTIIVGFYPKDIAIISILFLNVGDPIAAWVGGKYGTLRFTNGKSLQGTAAGIAGAFLAGSAFMCLISFLPSIIPDSRLMIWNKAGFNPASLYIILAGACVAFLVEFFSRDGFFDDNLLLPVAAGFFMCCILALSLDETWTYFFNDWHRLVYTLK